VLERDVLVFVNKLLNSTFVQICCLYSAIVCFSLSHVRTLYVLYKCSSITFCSCFIFYLVFCDYHYDLFNDHQLIALLFVAVVCLYSPLSFEYQYATFERFSRNVWQNRRC